MPIVKRRIPRLELSLLCGLSALFDISVVGSIMAFPILLSFLNATIEPYKILGAIIQILMIVKNAAAIWLHCKINTIKDQSPQRGTK